MSNQLPMSTENGGKVTEGCCTPVIDKTPQMVVALPRKVLPIIFIPGIMGTNLRLTNTQQRILNQNNNIAWHPDNKTSSLGLVFVDAADRQSRLNPLTTEVDVYDPVKNPTGDPSETSEDRHDMGDIYVFLNADPLSPLLVNDLKTKKGGKTKEQKAMERGWGEIYFSSYQIILESCEKYLNKFMMGKFWKSIINQSPSEFKAHHEPVLSPITEEECRKALAGCFFPVHAMGYNWLQSNGVSGAKMAIRIRELIKKYRSENYQCEKVIVVTHSMGGLVARALVHPEIGGLANEVLGVIHGAMPAVGAPAAYKRMRCGFEEGVTKMAIPPKVLGNYGYEVTAVLANAPGGLELLPSRAYGNNWLEIRQGTTVLKSLPEKGDPYSEIYQIRGRWFSLLREDWINPANLPGRGFANTCNFLQEARNFHESIHNTYHPCTYVHYSAEEDRPSWASVVWQFDVCSREKNWEDLAIDFDDAQGKFELRKVGERTMYRHRASLGRSVGAGDQTVPLRSSEHQLWSKKPQGIFRQSGYEHQASYGDKNVIRATMYSLIRIIQTMKWSENG